MKRWNRWVTVVTVVATAVALGLSSASATTPTPTPPVTPGPPTSGKLFDPAAVIRPARSETTFYPVAPCRIADTRKAGGALANLATRNFYVRGTQQFVPQGGTSGGCGIPPSATAVAANVTVVGGGGAGYLTGYPAGTGEPNTNFVTYNKGQNVTANPTLPLAAFGSNPHLTIRNHGTSAAHVIIDVTGYYAPQIQALVATSPATIYSGTTRVLSATRVAVGRYQVKMDSDVSLCTPTVTPYDATGQYAYAFGFSSNTVTVYYWTVDADGTPVAYDPNYFYLSVIC